MSLIDSNFPDLDLFLQGWRRRLNTRFLTGEALAAWCAATPVTLIAATAVRNPTLRLAVWAGFAGITALSFALWKARIRLSRAQAASWLDEAGGTLGLFRAASESLEQDEPDLGGRKVMEEADRRRNDFTGRRAPRVPLRRLALRAGLAVVLGAAALTILTLAAPDWGVPFSGAESEAPQKAVGPPSDPELAANESRELSPQEAARQLFPEDARLAALAEQALASGDPGALEALLEQNADTAQPAQTTPAQSGAGSGGAMPGEKAPSLGTAPPGDGGNPGTRGQKSVGGDEPGQAPRSGPLGNNSDREGNAPNKGEEGGSLLQAPGTSRQGQPGDGDSSNLNSGGAPGTGHSFQKMDSKVQTGTSDRQIALKEKKNPGIFEYILPGADSKLPTSQVLADSRRSAEAVISRTAPPLEFENTIRDYFLSLTSSPQEVFP